MESETMKWPQKDAIDDPVVYFPGPIDFAAVEEFLRLINPNFLGERADHLGRLATRMLEKRQNASPADLVQLATKIDAESRLAVNKLPDIILEQMNAPTVGRLLEDLRDLDAARIRVDGREHGPHDSIIRKVEDRFRRINDDPPPTRFSAQAIEEALSAADLRMKQGQLRPQAPCDLTTALRYVAGGTSTPPAAMESAFIDFLSLHRLEREKKWDSEVKATLLAQLERNLEFEQKVRKNRQKIASDHPGWELLKTANQNLRDKISRLDQRERILDAFVPGSEVRDPVFEEMGELVESNWKRSDSVSLRSLAWLSVDFLPFWQKHKKAYIDLHRSAEESRKKMKSARTSSGRSGLVERELKKSLRLVQKWIQFADSSKTHPKDAIDRFVIQAFESQTARNRLSVFLKILHDHVVRKSDPRNVVKTLCEKHGRKVMTVKIVEDCARELIQYLRTREKNRQ